MGVRNSYEGIDEYAVKLVRYKAKQLVGKSCFSKADQQDIEQELIFDLLRRLPKFNPSRAQRNTFIAYVVEHKVAELIQNRRTGYVHTCSLNERLEDEEGNQTEFQEIISQDEYFQIIGKYSRPLEELNDLSLDLKNIMAGLSPALGELLERLQNETVTEISRNTGIPRGTIYESMKKLKIILENLGVKKYL